MIDVMADARFRGAVVLDEGTPATPEAGQVSVFADQGRLSSKNSAGEVSQYATATEIAQASRPLTTSWTAYGHSYFSGNFVPLQTSRTDALLREALGIDHTAWFNRAVSGARISVEGRRQGGWTRIYQETKHSLGKTAGPYTPTAGGGMILCYGINDITGGDRSETSRQAYKMAIRSAISRWRAGAIFENSFNIGTYVTYGGTWGEDTLYFDVGSGNSVHYTTSVGASITLTLPSDYQGETVVLSFIGKDNTSGGTATISGTAGATGTINTSNVLPGFSFSRAPYVYRITNLTSANAGQTIVITTTQIGGDFSFDCWWLESLTPPPVIVCDMPRLTSTGYALYGSWAGTETDKDNDVLNWNAAMVDVVAEFDSLVQLAELDAALNKDPKLFADGLHPNDAGGALVVDAITTAAGKIQALPGRSSTGSLTPGAPRHGPMLRPRRVGYWFTADGRGAGSNYTAVAGDQFAIPFLVTQPNSKFWRLCVEAIASVTGTTLRWGVYDDVERSGYPQVLITDPTSGGAFTVTTGAGSKQNPANGTGSINFMPDPGLYWLVVKFDTAGASHTFRSIAGPSLAMPNMAATGVGNIQPSGWKLTGRGTGALDSVFPGGAALSDNCPMIGLQSY